MIPAGGRDHPARRQIGGQQPVERATRLKAAGVLQQFQLQRYRDAERGFAQA